MAATTSARRGRWDQPDDPGPPYSVGWKVARWLQHQRTTGGTPANPTALARAVGCDNKTVEGWIKRGNRPRADLVDKLARVMGVSLDWLGSPKSGWPPPDDMQQRLSALLAASSPAEQVAILEALGDPKMRRALAAYGATLPRTPPGEPSPRAPR